MTAYATNQAGNWDTAAIWTPNGTPGNGDTVSVDHAVTVDSDTIIGTSPAEGNVVVACTAALTVATDKKLTLRGDVSLDSASATFALSAGVTLEFDASQASDPTNQQYRVVLGLTHYYYNAILKCNGTSGNRCTVQSNAGGGNGYLWGNGTRYSGVIQADYTDFKDIGDATFPLGRPYLYGSAGVAFYLKHCTFDGCGCVGATGTYGVYNTHADADFEIEDCNFANGLGTYDLRFAQAAVRNTGIWSFQRNAFETGPQMAGGGGCTFDDNLLGGGTSFATNFNPTSFDGNLFYKTGGDHNWYFSASNSYIVNTDSTNPHNISVGGVGGRNQTMDGLVMDTPNGATTGDGIIGAAPASAVTVTIKNVLNLPNHSGEMGCNLSSYAGGANLTVSINHCTSYGGVRVGETYNAHAGMVSSLKSSIYWADGVQTVYKIDNANGAPNDDVVSAANADYNSGYGLTAGSESKGYNTPMTGTPGANDVEEDPQFVDDTRNIKTWDTSLGGAGSVANAITELFKLNTTGFDSNYTIAALMTYVRNGFKVQNANLEDAGHDSVTIGAMAFQAAGSPPPLPTHHRRFRTHLAR